MPRTFRWVSLVLLFLNAPPADDFALLETQVKRWAGRQKRALADQGLATLSVSLIALSVLPTLAILLVE
jgi:hypothetical protein